MTLSSPVEHSSRLDRRHQKLWCRMSSVCIVVRQGCWLWRTEAHHDDLLICGLLQQFPKVHIWEVG